MEKKFLNCELRNPPLESEDLKNARNRVDFFLFKQKTLLIEEVR